MFEENFNFLREKIKCKFQVGIFKKRLQLKIRKNTYTFFCGMKKFSLIIRQ